MLSGYVVLDIVKMEPSISTQRLREYTYPRPHFAHCTNELYRLISSFANNLVDGESGNPRCIFRFSAFFWYRPRLIVFVRVKPSKAW